MATTTPDRLLVERGQPLTTPQLFWLVVQATALAGVVLWQVTAETAPITLFWRDALGVKLAMAAATFIAVNFAALLGGWYVLNRLATASLRDQGLVRNGLQSCLCAGCFLFFYLPALLVLLIGPSVVAIQATLAQP